MYHNTLKVCFEKSNIITRRNTNLIILLPLKVIRKVGYSALENAKTIKHNAKWEEKRSGKKNGRSLSMKISKIILIKTQSVFVF